MISRLYSWFHRMSAPKEERGEYSGGAWQDVARRQALEFCKGKTGRCLEVGCGEGLFLVRLKQQEPGLSLFGIDNNAERLRQAGQRLAASANLSEQDATRLAFGDGYFDVIVCVNVLFNLDSMQSVEAAIKEMARVLRPGGSLILDFRNGANPLLSLKYATARFYDPSVKGLPLRTYTFGQMKRLFERCGLAVRSKVFLGAPLGCLSPLIMVEVGR
jgi:ubiquinone/menaquinone biosynthesis C-methylase UbiE